MRKIEIFANMIEPVGAFDNPSWMNPAQSAAMKPALGPIKKVT
jgi:hypothetical protein